MQTLAIHEQTAAPDLEDARRIVEELSVATWSFAALSACAEYELIERLDRPAAAATLASGCGLPTALVTRLLDVLTALGLVTLRDSLYAASPGVLQASAAFPGALAAFPRANLLQGHDLYRRGRRRTLDAAAWDHTDPDLLQAQGDSSGAFAHGFEHVLLPRLTGLGERLRAPDAAFLDVGAGVGAISIALCRRFPSLRSVALEPHEPALALARRGVERAGLGSRVALRRERIEELLEVERFDLAWLPVSFLAPDVVETALQRVWRALRPGGWALVPNVDADGDDLESATARLRCTRCGAAPRSRRTRSSACSAARGTRTSARAARCRCRSHRRRRASRRPTTDESGRPPGSKRVEEPTI